MMAGKSGASWIVGPNAGIAQQLARRTVGMQSGLEDLAASHAARAEAEMKQRAGWNDRTTHARGSLYGRADGTDIELGTENEEYGIHLELGTSKMQAFPTIVPVSVETAPKYFNDAGQLVVRMLGGGS